MSVDWAAVAGAVGAGAAAVSALVGLEQVTTASRRRREATFWRESFQAASSDDDKIVLQSLHRTANARIIGFHMIPARRLLLPVNMIVIPPVAIFAISWSAPEQFTRPENPWGVAIFYLAMAGWLAYRGILGIASAFALRRRVVARYLDPVTAGPVDLTADSSITYSIPLTGIERVSLAALSTGLAMVACWGGLFASPEFDGTSFFAVDSLVLAAVLLIPAGAYALRALYLYDRLDRRLGPDIGTARLLGGVASPGSGASTEEGR